MAVGIPLPTNYTDGEVWSAADVNDITGTINQLGGSNFAAGKNKIINGDFGVWQRGTSFGSNTYTADRWVTGGNYNTVTQQSFTLGSAPVAGYESKYFIRNVISANSGTGDYTILENRMEDVRTFAGQTVTVSFWAKAASGTPKIGIEMGQIFGSGGSASAFGTGQAVTISTSWVRYSITYSVPSISGKTIGTGSFLSCTFWLTGGSSFNTRSGSIGNQTGTFDIWGVQVEAGSTATAFQTATGTIQGELAACQRYYWRTGEISSYGVIGVASLISNTSGRASVALPVTMRTLPTSIDSSTLAIGIPGSSAVAISSVALSNTSLNYPTISFTFPANFSANQLVMLTANNSTSAYLGFSAEL